MGSPFQQQARQRKVIYLGLMVVLASASWAWRHYVVETKASELYIREQSRGEADLSGSVVRLSLTGSRGLATTVLWYNAHDKQKKNQWNELEMVVRSLTKLQPHFISPWLFQSWNLAYNVSVESDRIADKYFYITRGVLLLAEGERQNRDNPDLRFHIGFYTANKMHVSDETNVFRSLLQLSMIPPNERDPARFRNAEDGRQGINWAEFEQFCRDHPQLVRRLAEGMQRETKRELNRQFTCERAEDVVQFLADNYRLPCIYEDAPQAVSGTWRKDTNPRKRELEDRFPTLPPRRDPQPPQHLFDRNELTIESTLDDTIDCHALSRAWYGYSQEPIPDCDDLPGSTREFEDRARQHRPRNIATLLFRNYPARAQTYLGERLEQEGWFDEAGWEPTRWFKARNDQAGGGNRNLVIGNTIRWAHNAWDEAFKMWERTGRENKLLLTPAQDKNYRDQAEIFIKKFSIPQGTKIPDNLRTDTMDKETQDQYFAARYMWEFKFYRDMSNFPHHYTKTRVEALDEAIQARKRFYEGDRLRFSGDPEQGFQLYDSPEGVHAWRDKVLLQNKDFRRDRNAMEDASEIQAKYLDLFYEQYGRLLRQRLGQKFALLALAGDVAQAGIRPGIVPDWYPLAVLARERLPFNDVDFIVGPFDCTDKDGVPLVTEDIFHQTEDRNAERQFGKRRRQRAVSLPLPTTLPRKPSPETGSVK